MKIRSMYFLVAVVGIGTIGIWWPIILESLGNDPVNTHTIPPNLITYSVAIIFAGAIDNFMFLLRKDKSDKILFKLFGFLGIILASFGIVALGTYVYIIKNDLWAYIIGFTGMFASWRIWWLASLNNENLNDPIDPENAVRPKGPLAGSSAGFNIN